MRKEDIKKSFDEIKPSKMAMGKMLDNVLKQKEKTNYKKSLNLTKLIPVAALICVLVISGISYNFGSNFGLTSPPDNTRTDSITDGDLAGREDGDMAIEIKDQFRIEDRHYIILSETQRESFNFPSTIKEVDIGRKITTIVTTVDESLKGKEVYEYIPAGGEAVVAVKRDNKYILFNFLSFDSYTNNKDEDVLTYLKLYGINSATDMAKIQFLSYSEEAKIRGVLDVRGEITDIDKITEFFNYYSVIKDSSDKYFEKLYNYRKDLGQRTPSEPSELPPDYKAPAVTVPGDANTHEGQAEDLGPTPPPNTRPIVDTGEAREGSDSQKGSDPREGSSSGQGTTPSEGWVGDALFNSLTIRIYNQRGLYLDVQYYPNLGFISRHEVSDEFALFLAEYIRK